MKFVVIRREKALFPISLMCRMLDVTRGGFYAWVKRGESKHTKADRALALHVRASFRASRKTYGSPRVLQDLRDAGHRTSKKRVARIMSEQHLATRRRKRRARTTDSNHHCPVAPNIDRARP